MDVKPYVEFTPVRQRKYPDALALVVPAVKQVPKLGPLALRIPLSHRIAERIDTLFCSRLLLITARAPECSVKSTVRQCVEQRSGLQSPAALLCAQRIRSSAIL